MKKHIYIILILFLGFGCSEDLLEKYPVTTLNPEIFWQSEQDALYALNALYPFLPEIGEIDMDNLTDIAVNSYISGNDIMRGQYDATESLFQNLWEDGYEGISAVNRYIESTNEMTEILGAEVLNRFQAEARVIRAQEYMYLISYFGDVPFFTKPLNVEEGLNITREDKDVIYDFIFEELMDAAQKLPMEYSSNDVGRITKGAAYAFLTRAMLYAGRWDKAKDAALEVINLNQYSIDPDYASLFKYEGEYNSEIILEHIYAKDLQSHNFLQNHGPYELTTETSGLESSITGDLVNAYESINGYSIDSPNSNWDSNDPYKNRDTRLYATVWIPAYSNTSFCDTLWGKTKRFDTRPGSGQKDEVFRYNRGNVTGFLMKKYNNQEDISSTDNCGGNFIVLRFADVLLMYAEAKIELNEIDNSVIDAINQVRSRMSVSQPDLQDIFESGDLANQSFMREVIRKERMIELAMEGLRLYDIRRWKTAEILMQGPIPGMEYEDINSGEVETVIWDGTVRVFDPAKDYLFAIPRDERQLNPNLAQNPGF